MASIKSYGLFISHAWRYHDDYDRLGKLLNAAATHLHSCFGLLALRT